MGFGYGGSSQARSRAEMARHAPAKQRRYTFGSHANTAHIWAQQNAETHTGQSGDGRVRFAGPTIYSFGTHFPMATFTDKRDAQGRRLVLINSDRYSVSTGSHQSHVRGALNGADVVTLDIPALGTWLGYMSPKDRAKYKRDLWESALESIVTTGRVAASVPDDEDEWHREYTQRRANEAQAQIALLRLAFNINAKVPADLPAWYDARKAKQADAKRRAAIREALAWAKRLPDELPEHYAASDDASEWALQDRADRIAHDATKLRRWRNTLSKTGRYGRLVAKCRETIKKLAARKAELESLAQVKRDAAQRESAIRALQEIRAYFRAGEIGNKPTALYSVDGSARLWAVAIAENMPDVADYLARRVHAARFDDEIEWRVPPKADDKITPDEWRAGKGNSYYSNFADATLLRRKGDVLQTSRGADCPWAHAVAAFKAAQACRRTHKRHVPNGHTIKVGHFRVDLIDENGTLKAGCHTLEFPEMLRLAVKEVPDIVAPSYPLPVPIGNAL